MSKEEESQITEFKIRPKNTMRKDYIVLTKVISVFELPTFKVESKVSTRYGVVFVGTEFPTQRDAEEEGKV